MCGGRSAMSHHGEKRDWRRLRFTKDNRPSANDGQCRISGGAFDPSPFGGGKHTRQQATRREAPGGHTCVITNVALRLETAGDLLRVIAFNAAAERKIRRAAENEIEILTDGEGVRRA